MEHTRPSRSDVHLTAEQSAEVESATRHYFEEAAPKRHTKPQRSEYSSAYTDALSGAAADDIPEYARFQSLEKDDDEKVVYEGRKVEEEFTETEYYKDLNVIDKHHHTTGTGFKKVDGNGHGFRLAPDSGGETHASSKGNPATNDWIPATAEHVDFGNGKPSRSG